MTQDEIIDMAIQAGASPDENKIWLMYAEEIKAFANLVAAKEREACAKVVQVHLEASDDLRTKGTLVSVLDYIRARGEA